MKQVAGWATLPSEMSLSHGRWQPLLASLIYKPSSRDWVFSLKQSQKALPLWRTRMGCYAFILINRRSHHLRPTDRSYTRFLQKFLNLAQWAA